VVREKLHRCRTLLLAQRVLLEHAAGTLERSRRLLGVAGLCLVAVVCVIVFLTPVQLPSWRLGLGDDPEPASTTVKATVKTTAGQTTLTSEADRVNAY
jgi:hypothetical protein